VDRFGITDKLRQAERSAGEVQALKHSYTILYENKSYRINPSNVSSIGWGFDYYLEVLRQVEQSYDMQGLTFFISNECPSSLPKYGSSVVLLVLCDESYKYYSYFYNLRCIFKCYTLKPPFVFPSVGLSGRVATTFQLLMKSSASFRSRISAHFGTRASLMRFLRIYSLPLGYFAKPNVREPEVERDIGFLFAGSVEYPTVDTLRIRDIMPPPKLASRRLMAAAARTYLKAHPGSGLLRLTDGFLGSVSNADDYWPLLRRAKIALCPRGGVPETYRFFEAAIAGCAIVSEALPRAWYYEGHPAIIVPNWRGLGCVLDELLQDENKLAEMARRSTHYWKTTIRECVVAEYIAQRLESQDRFLSP
jgi:hypothetical protein